MLLNLILGFTTPVLHRLCKYENQTLGSLGSLYLARYPLYLGAEKQKNKQKDFILNFSFYDFAMSFSRSKNLFVYLSTYDLGTYNTNSISKHRSWILTKIISI